jgi:putative peptidoglycan lipid II flippase
MSGEDVVMPLMPAAAVEQESRRQRQQSARAFVGHARLMGAITFVSRILGMARESIAAAYFGSNAIYSAFTFAFTIPNLFRKLLGEGALSAAFIPLYAQAVKREQSLSGATEGPPEALHREALSANDFAAASVNLLCSVLLALTVMGELILLLVVALVPMRPDRLLAMQLTMIMLPYVLLVCGTAFLGSILQVHARFAAITATAIVSNLCLIVAMIAAARAHDLTTDAGQLAAVRWLSVSVLVAGVLQIVMLLPSLRAAGFRFRTTLHFMTPAVRKMIRMTVPVALGAGVLQVSTLLDKSIAFYLSRNGPDTHMSFFGHQLLLPMAEGATQRLNWAQFMYQFPLGVFAIALATAIFPKLSAEAIDTDRKQFKEVLRHGVEASLFIGLPASVGLIVVRYPAVRLLFERGNFTADDTKWVALSTAIYSAAIWAFSLQQILNRAYYALHDTWTPLVWGIVNLAMNLIIEMPLLWTGLGESGMAVGTLASFAFQAIVMLWMLDRRVGGIELRRSAGSIGKMIFAASVMWLACAGVQRAALFPTGSGKLVSAAQLTILIAVGGGTYFLMCAALGLRTPLASVRNLRFSRR